MNSLIWLIASMAIGGFLGQQFRGNAKVGTLLGLLGPLGWILVLVVKDLRAKCPKCMSTLNPGATRCARCGADLPQVVDAPAGLGYGAAQTRDDTESWKKVLALSVVVALAMAVMIFLVVKFS